MKKKLRKSLEKCAALLPPITYTALEYDGPEIQKAAIDKYGSYTPKPVKRQGNHINRLKTAYRNNGLQGIKDYMGRFGVEFNYENFT